MRAFLALDFAATNVVMAVDTVEEDLSKAAAEAMMAVVEKASEVALVVVTEIAIKKARRKKHIDLTHIEIKTRTCSGFFFFYLRSYDFRKTSACRKPSYHLLVGEGYLLVYALTYTGCNHDRAYISYCVIHRDQNAKDAL